MPILTAGTKRVLYIHVPKTGGTYIENLLRSYGDVSGIRYGLEFNGLPCSPQHLHGPLLEHMYSLDTWEARHGFDLVFMTVRDPVERLKSEFRYRRSIKSFDGWIKETLSAYQRDPFVYDNHIRPQKEFSAFDAKVFRLEDGLEGVREELDRLTGTSGVRQEGRANQSRRHDDYRLSGEGKRLLLKHAEGDTLLYGYHASLA